MSFFYHNDDPLLSSRTTPPPVQQTPDFQVYRQQFLNDIQTQTYTRDWIQELDSKVASLDTPLQEALAQNSEYVTLSTQVQQAIQNEIVNLIKPRLNQNPEIYGKIKRQLEIIGTVDSKVRSEERQNLSDLNDYVKNFSHLTFDEYRKIKNSPQENISPASS